jgi:hypothetical protein
MRKIMLFLVITSILFFAESCVTVEQIYPIKALEDYTCEEFKGIVARMIETPDDFRVVMQEYGMVALASLEYRSDSEIIRNLELIKEYGGYPDTCYMRIFKSMETDKNVLSIAVTLKYKNLKGEFIVDYGHFSFRVVENEVFHFYGIYRKY